MSKQCLDKATKMPGQGIANAWIRRRQCLDKAGKALAKALATHSKITSIMFAAIFQFQSPPHNCQFGFDVALSGDGYVRS